MAQIIVQAGSGERPGPVTLRERVNGDDLKSEHFTGRLIERIGWALTDAEDLEAAADLVRQKRRLAVHGTRRPEGEMSRTWPPKPS